MTIPTTTLGPLSKEEIRVLKAMCDEMSLVPGITVLRLIRMIEARDAIISQLAKEAGYDDGAFIPEKGSEP